MNPKITHIFNCAMSILKESGDQGLSMRKVADKADMRLSNLQYYFKTKELLLSALLDAFLKDYALAMQSTQFSEQSDPKLRLDTIILTILLDIEKTECAVVFKELWAISERNEVVKRSLDEYYQSLYNMIFLLLKSVSPDVSSQKNLHQAVSILLPFIEGFCITRTNLGVSTTTLAKQLSTLIYSVINQ